MDCYCHEPALTPSVYAWVQVPLKAALPFLEGALRAAGEKRRNSAVVKSLRRAENLQLREAVIKCRQRCPPAPACPGCCPGLYGWMAGIASSQPPGLMKRRLMHHYEQHLYNVASPACVMRPATCLATPCHISTEDECVKVCYPF